MRNLISILLLVIAAACVYYFMLPMLKDIGAIQKDVESLEALKERAGAAEKKREEILARYRDVSQEDSARLDAFTPAKTNREDLYAFYQALVLRSGMKFNTVSISLGSSDTVLTVSVNAEGTYRQFRSLLDLVENNLRIMDVKVLGLGLGDAGSLNVTISGLLYEGVTP